LQHLHHLLPVFFGSILAKLVFGLDACDFDFKADDGLIELGFHFDR
jgi:hypothetical protein